MLLSGSVTFNNPMFSISVFVFLVGLFGYLLGFGQLGFHLFERFFGRK